MEPFFFLIIVWGWWHYTYKVKPHLFTEEELLSLHAWGFRTENASRPEEWLDGDDALMDKMRVLAGRPPVPIWRARRRQSSAFCPTSAPAITTWTRISRR